MELATIPQNSSAMSTEGPTQTTSSDSSGQRGARKKKPAKAASDSRVDEAATTTARERPPPPHHSGRRHRQSSAAESDEEILEEQALKYGASHVIHLFVPVSLCMAMVILTMLTVGYYSEAGEYLPYTPFHAETDNTGVLILQSLGNALILLGVIIVMTIVLIILYKYRCYKIIHGWLMLSSLMLLSVFTVSYIEELLKNYNIPIDYITLIFFVWNWCVVGLFVIHWKGPLLLQQFYLISMSALMALMFIKYLPEWSVWSILAVLSIWDLVAVLCPKGPLRILVETAQERNEPIFPALIYSSGVLYLYTIYSVLTTEPGAAADEDAEQQQQAGTSTAIGGQQQRAEREGSATSTDGLLSEGGKGGRTDNETAANGREEAQKRYAPGRKAPHRNATSTSGDTLITTIGTSSRQATPSSQRSRSPRRAASEQNLPAHEREAVEERGVKLGLGDFIFYSVLVGKASYYGDWNLTIACYVSILVGLAFTLLLLALFRKALPALPISIFAGIVFFFATKFLITPFIAQVALRQIVL